MIAVAATVSTAFGVTTTSVSFQNGVNGYTDTFDRKISEEFATPGSEVNGSTVQQYAVDGFGANSLDAQGLIRFDNIIGSGPGQIPNGAFILDAQLTLTTAGTSNAQTNGPWGVARLLNPFTAATSYADYTSTEPGGRGAWYQDGHATRAAGNFGGALALQVISAPITSLVQAWASGEANNGLVVQAGFTGTTDGWNIDTTGNNTPTNRPKLSATYTADPLSIRTFQHGVGGYMDDTMAWVRSGTNLTGTDPQLDDVTTDGTSLTQAFLDGPDGASSPDDLALMKFANIFGSGPGQASPTESIAKAWLVITTGDTNANARSPGQWTMNTLLREFDTTQLYSSFGATPGLQAADGDIVATPVDTKSGMITGSEVWFDVTSQVEAIRNGAANNGFAILANTSDGWQIHFNGSDVETARPRLIVASVASATTTPLLGDFNGDHSVDAADYIVWKENFGTSFNLNGNGDETGPSQNMVDDADYAMWSSHFGNTSAGGGADATGAPEPCTWVLAVAAVALELMATGRRAKRAGRPEYGCTTTAAAMMFA
jgi:hypothetical protein